MLRPGGVLTMSDIPTARLPRTPGEMIAAWTQLRAWGLGMHAAATADEIVGLAFDAGFVDVRAESVGERMIGPALRFVRDRLDRAHGSSELPRSTSSRAPHAAPGRPALGRGVLDYLLLRGTKPPTTSLSWTSDPAAARLAVLRREAAGSTSRGSRRGSASASTGCRGR